MSSGPRLYLVHGAGGTRFVWHFQTAYFRNAEAVSLPGHPEGAGRRWIEDYVAWLHELLTSRREGRVVLVGHSMGGAIAQLHALLYPQDLRALVLVSTGARLRVSPRLLEAIDRDYRRAVDLMVDWAFGPGTDPRVRRKSAQVMLQVPAEVTRGDFEASDRFDVRDRLSEIDLPTLVVCGTADLLTPVKYSEYLASHVKGAQLRLVEGAGHMVMMERPAEFNRILKAFLDTLPD